MLLHVQCSWPLKIASTVLYNFIIFLHSQQHFGKRSFSTEGFTLKKIYRLLLSIYFSLGRVGRAYYIHVSFGKAICTDISFLSVIYLCLYVSSESPNMKLELYSKSEFIDMTALRAQ